MKYSIIIPTYNHLNDYLIPCINSIERYTDLDNYEIIVIANGCSDQTEDYLKSKPNIKGLVFEQALGFTKSVNIGIENSLGEYIIILNNDIELLPQITNQWIKMLEDPFSDPKVAVVGPHCIKDNYSEKEFIVFFCAMIKKSILKEFNNLDEIFSPGFGEDIDFCLKVQNAGYKFVHVGKHDCFPIWHKDNGTFGEIADYSNKIVKRNGKILKERYNQIKLPKGYFSEYDIKDYRKLVEQIPDNGTMIEIGTFRGRSLCSVSDIIQRKNIKVIAIDTFEGTPTEDSELNDYYEKENILEEFKSNILKFGIKNYVNIYKGKNEEYANLIENKTVDLIFIDADHSYEAVKQDIDVWKNKLKSSGILAGHDILWESVKQAVDEKFNNDYITCSNIWIKEMMVKDKEILCSISTRGRYLTTLPSVLFAVINQTKLPDHLIIFDDNDLDKRIDLREQEIYQHIFKLLDMKNISWEVVFGQRKGQHYNHQIANSMDYKWVWRVDDDVIPESNVLEELYNHTFDSATINIGAVGGSIICPTWNLNINNPKNISGRIEDIDSHQNPQWFKIKQYQEVDHLHCSFLYRAGIVDYNLNLSRIAHREETLFTWQLKQKDYKIIIIPNAISYHLKAQQGGIRDGQLELYQNDEEIFRSVINNMKKLIVLDNGIGDHIVFKSILPEILEKYSDVTISCCYPFVFEEYPDLNIISIEEAKRLVNHNELNIYKKMIDWNWQDSLQNAYRKLYL